MNTQYNVNGLSWSCWLFASGWSNISLPSNKDERKFRDMLRQAWIEGEDPTDWKAEKSRLSTVSV